MPTELMSPIFEEAKGGGKKNRDAGCSPFDKYQTLIDVHATDLEVDDKEKNISVSDSAINDEESIDE